MGRGLFITGSDTGVGKTLIAAGIVRYLRDTGIDAAPMKPVQTGGGLRRGRLVAPDLEFCLSASGLLPGNDEKQSMQPYVYAPACSPHLAGRLAGHYPDPHRIQQCADRLLAKHGAVVVEGAGGVMAPLDESHTMLDLMKTLGYPVVLVARTGLGTINHCLLSIDVLKASGIRLVGVVFNHVEPSTPDSRFIEDDNPKTVARLSGVPVLGALRHFDKVDPKSGAIWAAFEQDVPGLEDIRRELAV